MSETALAETAPPYSSETGPAYKRLTQTDLGLVLRYLAEGLTQTAIAQRLAVSPAAISQATRRLGTDATELAKHHFRASSYKAARRTTRLVQSDKGDVALKAARLVLEGAGVISSGTQGVGGVQVNVVVGLPNQGALDASTITLGVVDKALEK